MNKAAVDAFGWPAFNFYWKIKGLFKEFNNADEVAKETGMSLQTLKETFAQYKQIAAGETPDPYGKKSFPATFDPDLVLYVATVIPSIHYTMGGLEITPQAEVVGQSSGKPIEGLYAAGEVTGGVHVTNRLAGNSLLECVVFGRIAGVSAAKR